AGASASVGGGVEAEIGTVGPSTSVLRHLAGDCGRISRRTEEAGRVDLLASESRPPGGRPPLGDPDATGEGEPIARLQLLTKRRLVDAPVRVPQCDEGAHDPFVFVTWRRRRSGAPRAFSSLNDFMTTRPQSRSGPRPR